jgi:hypothetical protein
MDSGDVRGRRNDAAREDAAEFARVRVAFFAVDFAAGLLPPRFLAAFFAAAFRGVVFFDAAFFRRVPVDAFDAAFALALGRAAFLAPAFLAPAFFGAAFFFAVLALARLVALPVRADDFPARFAAVVRDVDDVAFRFGTRPSRYRGSRL